MLGLMRSLTQNKFTGGILLGLVILSMAVWGIDDIFSGNFGQNIIQAGERGITEQQLNRKFENYLNTVRLEQPGNAITRRQATEQGILDQIYNVEQSRIINLGYARSLGADASPQALLEDVRSISAFQNPLTNEFDQQYYRNALVNSRISVEEFESDAQDRLTLNYLRDSVEAAAVPPTDIARVQAIFDGEVRSVAWLPIERVALPPVEDPTEEELASFYEEREESFELPERRQLTLLNLSADDFIHQAVISDETIEANYEATKTRRLATPEQRTFLEAVFQNEEAAKQAFGVLAVGGDLPPTDGVTQTIRTSTAEDVGIEAFREQLFAEQAKDGAVAGPFQTPAGWVIGSLIEILPGTPKTLEETRDEIRAELAAQEAELSFYKALNEMDDLIGQGLSLDEIGETFGAPVISFAPVDARGLTKDGLFLQEVTISPDAFRQAFELPQGTITDRFEDGTRTIMLAIDRIIPRSVPPLEENRTRAETAYKVVKENDAMRAALDTAKTELEAGTTTLEALAERYKSAVERPQRGLRRTAFDANLPRPVLQSAFTLSEGDISIVQGRTPTELIIVKLEAIDRPKTEELDVLAPVSAPKIAEQLSNDMLFAFEQDVLSALDLQTDDARFAAYKARLLQDQ